ncbi:MAG TPA: hypothetical protein PKZ46_03360 [Candidatus Cloacimonadota bacterium]|nr:hypothetical protein [Candidatus Cloacimonadota bacterium]
MTCNITLQEAGSAILSIPIDPTSREAVFMQSALLQDAKAMSSRNGLE